MGETHIHWLGTADESVTVFGQTIQLRTGANAEDPIGTLYINLSGDLGTPTTLPNSVKSSATWTPIPGTNPAIEVRQDGHYPLGFMRVRIANTFTNLTPVNASIQLGSVAGATRLEESGDVVRMRGFIQATGAIASGQVLANIGTVAHRPLHAISTGVRYTAGSNRLQIATNGDITLTASLALNDQIWLDSLTFDRLA